LWRPLGDHVYFAPGAKVFGKITVGHYVKIDMNAVIYPDIPNMAVAAMKPGVEILSMNGNQP
jgi:serine O-acetyltransferase